MRKVKYYFGDRYPFQVRVENYIKQMHAKKLPRPEEVNRGASWVEGVPGSRIFGFKTAEDLEWFKQTFGVEDGQAQVD